MRPSTDVSVSNSNSDPRATASAVTNRASGGCDPRRRKISSKRARYDAVGPRNLAECTPGAPPSASISSPESSATATSPVAAAYANALMRAFSQKVAPVSAGSAAGPTSASVTMSMGRSASSGPISRTLFGLVVAMRILGTPERWRTRLAAKDRLHDCALFRDQIGDAFVGQREQAGESIGPERFGLRGTLNLDETAVTCFDDIHVDIGFRVFFVGEVEERHAAHHPHADGRHVVGHWNRLELIVLLELAQCDHERHKRAGDRRAARAAVGLDDIAVEPDGALAEMSELDDRPHRAADQPLDFHGASTDLAGGGFATRPRGGGARQHPVLRGDPALAGVAQERRHFLFDARGADHARVPDLNQHRSFGVHREVRRDGDGTKLVGRAIVEAAGH